MHFYPGVDNIDNPEYRKNVIDCFVNSVYLYDDHIMLNYNSEKGAKTVTFSDILSSDLDDSPPSFSTMKPISGLFCDPELSYFFCIHIKLSASFELCCMQGTRSAANQLLKDSPRLFIPN